MKTLSPAVAAALLLTTAVSVGCGKKKKDDAAAAASTPTLTVTGSGKAAASASLERAADTHGGAANLTIGLYALYVSLSDDCTAPVLVADNGATAVDADFLASPTLFSGSPTGGTYKCMIMVMSDMLRMKPDAAAVAAWPGQCVSGTEYAGDICHDNDSDWKDQTGAALTCHSNAADKVVIFASTNATAPITGALHASSNQVVPLAQGLVVPGTATFYVDTTDAISNGNNGCNLEKPVFGFR